LLSVVLSSFSGDVYRAGFDQDRQQLARGVEPLLLFLFHVFHHAHQLLRMAPVAAIEMRTM
jgi:hypothetical protein